jgi:hypothetical protein
MGSLLKMLDEKFNGFFTKVISVYCLCIVFFCIGKINDNSVASYIIAFVLMNVALLFALIKSYYDALYPKRKKRLPRRKAATTTKKG